MKRGKPLQRKTRLRAHIGVPERVLVNDDGMYRVDTGARKHGSMRTCAECGVEFYVKPSRLGSRRFCSRKCANARTRKSVEQLKAMGDHFREAHRGPGNPQWRGSDTEGSVYRVFNVKLKGDACCRVCGSDHALHLHHIVPRSMCKAGRRDLRNGVTLCASCHAHWHAHTLTIYREAFTPEEWAFVSSLELLGQSVTSWLDRRYPPREVERLGPEVRL